MLLCNMASLEKDLFVKNVDKFLSRRDENIVIDDELIGSRAQDAFSSNSRQGGTHL